MRSKLFPFSLIRRAEQWYTLTIGSMNGDWEELRADFCHSFSLIKRINSLLIDILDFEQLEKETIGAAWARFLRLLASSPDLSIFEDDPLGNIQNTSNLHDAQLRKELSSISIDPLHNLLTEPSLSPTVPPSSPNPLHEQFLEEVVEVEQSDGARCFPKTFGRVYPLRSFHAL